jgi:hypothetical protein
VPDTGDRSIGEQVDGTASATCRRRVYLDEEAAVTRRRVGPLAWAVLEVLVTASQPVDGGGFVAELNVRSIARVLGVSKDTVASALVRLIDGGLVARESARFTRSRYSVVGEVGLHSCPDPPRPNCSDISISDKHGPCALPIPGQTLPRN